MSASAMEYTGERMVPECADDATFWEHIYRYRFAVEHIRGKRVLDIACGEGYGAAAMAAAGAQQVIGVDISEEAVAHARDRYGLDARLGDAMAIPLPDGSIDCIVSFETIEHVPEPARFLEECYRVLTPGGSLIVSTPNKDVYLSDAHAGEVSNPYHCSELTREEFRTLLRQRFTSPQYYTQHALLVPKNSRLIFATAWCDWLKVRGFYRLRTLLRSRFCPWINQPVTEAVRQDTVHLITRQEKGDWCNPFAIHPDAENPEERHVYLLAHVRRA